METQKEPTKFSLPCYHDAATTTEFPTRICYFVVSHVGFRLAGSSCIPTGRLLLVFLFDLN